MLYIYIISYKCYINMKNNIIFYSCRILILICILFQARPLTTSDNIYDLIFTLSYSKFPTILSNQNFVKILNLHTLELCCKYNLGPKEIMNKTINKETTKSLAIFKFKLFRFKKKNN